MMSKHSFWKYFLWLGMSLLLASMTIYPSMAEENWMAKWQDLNKNSVKAYEEGRYADGITMARQALALAQRHLGKHHPETLGCLNNLAMFYKALGLYKKAEPILKKILRLNRKILGPEHLNTISSLNNLGTMYKVMSRMDEAEPLLKEALGLNLKILGEKHPDTLASMSNLGLLYMDQGHPNAAETLLTDALRLSREFLGLYHSDTINYINNLGLLYQDQGRFGEAESLLRESLVLHTKVFGEKHPKTLLSMNSLAMYYLTLNRPAQAEPLSKTVLHASLETLGKPHPDTLMAMTNLAMVYKAMHRYEEAEPLFLETLPIYRKVLGDDHPDTLANLNNLGFFYFAQNKHEKAEQFFQESLRMHREKLGNHHPNTLKSINNLAMSLQARHHFKAALPLLWEFRKEGAAVWGPAHPHVLSAGLNLVAALINSDEKPQAVQVLESLEPPFVEWLDAQFSTAEARSTRRMVQKNVARYQSVVLSLALQFDGDAIERLATRIVLRWKGMEGEREQAITHMILNSKDPKIQDQAKRVQELRGKLPSLFHGPNPEAAQEVLATLDREETALRKASERFEAVLAGRLADADSIRNRLPDHSALLIVRGFGKYDFKDPEHSVLHFAGLLIRPHHKTLLRDLGKPGNWDLFTRLSQPFGEALNEIKRLYVVPDRELSLLPFETASMDSMGIPWLAKVDIRRLETGREFLFPVASSQTKGSLVMGDMDYSGPIDSSPPETPETSGMDFRAVMGHGMPIRFRPLAFSGEESQAVAKKLGSKSDFAPVRLLQGKEAQERVLKELTVPPKVLHLSTHGFYLRPSQDVTQPLLLGGVALAGANTTLRAYRQGMPVPSGHDGILFAVEAQDLRLEGTQLVVLSACETAQGTMDRSEGIEGLARALRIAGARHVLLALTPVPDLHTKQFMEAFYHVWLENPEDPQAALRTVKLQWFREGRNQETWTPFIMIGL